MKEILAKAKIGIDMNLLACLAPDQMYYSDLCPAGLRGYIDRGHAWRFYVPSHLQFRATNNLLDTLQKLSLLGLVYSPAAWNVETALCQ